MQGFVPPVPMAAPSAPVVAGNGTMNKLSKMAIRQRGKWQKIGTLPKTGGVLPTG